jgi:acid phosphatase class B
MTDDELDARIDKRIAAAFNNIGIYYGNKDETDASRANSTIINSIRIARHENQGWFKRLFSDALSSAGGQALWVLAAATFAAIFLTLKAKFFN